MSTISNDLVFFLTENARISLKEISKQLKLSPQRLKYSQEVLKKKTILKNPYCVFDYSYFGLLLFRVYYRGAYVSESEKERIIKELKQNKYVVSIYEMTGEFDLVIELLCPNPSRFNKEYKNLNKEIPTLNDSKVLLNFVTYINPRLYLTNKPNLIVMGNEIIVGGDRTIETFSPQEMALIKIINDNPLMWYTQLSKKSGMNIKTMMKIWNDLHRRKIIRGFKYMIDQNNFGINRFRLMLRLHSIDFEREKTLLEMLLKTKEVVQINKTIGDWSMEVDVESFDKRKIRTIYLKIKEMYRETIGRASLIEFHQLYQRRYLPGFLFEPEK